jgi:transcription antitermination factor NusG
VADHLQAKEVEAFLPLLSEPSRWKDRRVIVERPIFPGYVFVRIDLAERHRIFGTPSVVRMLAFGGAPAAIDDSEIDAVRLCLSRGTKAQAHPFPGAGELVRVKSGALEGLEGIVVRQKNECRIVVSISLIHKSIAAEVDAHLLEPVTSCPAGRDMTQ